MQEGVGTNYPLVACIEGHGGEGVCFGKITPFWG